MQSLPSTSRPSRETPLFGIWSRLLLASCTGLIMLALVLTTAGIILNLRDASLRGAETTMRSLSVVLADQADRSLQALDLVLAGIVDALPASGVHDSASYAQAMAGARIHLQLQDKIIGMPYVNALTLIDAGGNLINFSRAWPIPRVNVADRDYFRAMREDPHLERFISAPVANRGDGTWTVYLAHQVRAADGSFAGLVLGAIELRYYQELYHSVSISPSGTLVLLREDGTLLVRYPPTAAIAIGDLVANSGIVALNGGNAGVIRDISPFDGTLRIKAARRLTNFPLVMVATQGVGDALGAWRRTAWVLVVIALLCCLSIVVAASAIGHWWRQQETLAQARAERAESDRALALAELGLLRERARAATLASTGKSDFLAAMSHEIRTPLNAVLALAGLLLDSDLAEPQHKLVQTIHQSGKSLLLILNDILDFTKLDAGRVQFEAISFSPATLTEEVAGILAPHAATKPLLLRTDIDPTLPPALAGDAGRVRQVLLNLASNAVKFTQAGVVELGVRVASRTEGTIAVEWWVRDSGIGIAPDRVASLFTPFAQADSSITRRFGGTGLGLAICKRLVEQMGGEIALESTPGQGSVFRFHLTLPITEAVAAAVEPGDSSAALAHHIAQLGRRLRVLFAEDNPTNQFVALQLLKGFAVQVDVAGNGLEAVAAASHIAYDVICMDISMPEMDGLAATRAIRALAGPAATVPIIALTANAFPEDVRACMDAGMDLFIAKPVSKQSLVGAILRLIAATVVAPARAPVDAAGPNPGADPGAGVALAACDAQALTALADDISAEGVAELVAVFIAETTQRLRRMVDPGCDAMRLTREAHTLKGGAGTAGAPHLARLAGAIEMRLRAGGSVSADDVGALAVAFDVYAAAVRAVVQREPTAA